MRPLLAGFALLTAAATTASASEREPVDLVISNVSVVDVSAGTTTPNQSVVIEGATIRAVGAEQTVAALFDAERRIDGTGKFAMPGLWDMHVHFGGGAELIEENSDLLPLYVAYGVTAVRDAAADISDSVLAWRSAVAEGRLTGPRIFTSGPKLEGLKPLWKGTIEVGSEAEVDTALDRLQAMRVDFVKITDNTLEPELFLYAVRQASARGLKTSAHIPLSLTVEQAAAAGLSSVEHIAYLIKAGSPREAGIGAAYAAGKLTYAEASGAFIDSFDAAYAERSYRRLAELGLHVTPTLNMGRILAYLDEEDHSNDPELVLIGPGLRKTYDWRVERAAKSTAEQVAARRREYQLSRRILPMLQRAGIKILAGTDAGYLNSFNYPGKGLHDELERFVETGLTPQQALAASIVTGPAFLGHSDGYGALAPGKAADLLLVAVNPLSDIKATRSIEAVVLRGRLLDRAALDAMLAAVRAKAAAK